jgi:hypothetical protein
VTRKLARSSLLLIALASSLALPVAAQEPGAGSVPAPDGALTARFTSFFGAVASGHVPGGNLTAQVKSGLTQQLVNQIDSGYSSFGHFRRLEFVSADSMQGYNRYHYRAVFDNGSQGVMFVTDSSGTIAGFFEDPTLQ